MRAFKTEGIIIKRKNYSEADRILTVLTKFHGKIQVKAAGIRRIPSRRASHVELLNYSFLSLYRGRSYPILTEAQSIDSFSPIKDDFTKVGLAFHLCELIDGLCPENQENTKVFYLLKNTLHKLSFPCHSERSVSEVEESHSTVTGEKSSYSVRSIIHEFEIELLTTLGYYSKANILTQNFNARDFIESILERKLKSYYIFAKL